MFKKIISTIFISAVSAQAAFGDWHHHGSHGDSPPSPSADSFVVTGIIIILSSLSLLLVMGPILVIRAHRIRVMLWMIPTMNLALYILSISLRPYPGGFLARFAPPGLGFTILEVLLLLLLSACIVVILAIAHWAKRKYRALRATHEIETENPDITNLS